MEHRRNNKWSKSDEAYTPSQVEGVLEHCGISIDSETYTHFLCYCPFHGNTDSPALAVDKVRGLYNCFNPSCNQAGTIMDLMRKLKGMNYFQSMRLLMRKKSEQSTPFSDRLAKAMTPQGELTEFSQEALDRMKADFRGSVGEEYMKSRGFSSETLDYFDIGFSHKKNMVVVPMHDIKGRPIGIIGRTPSHKDKRFKNSTGLPKSMTLWNIHRARREGESVVVCEASYDAMRIHQAGYPNVVAFLGGSASPHQLEQLSRNFSTIILMTDYDEKQYRPNCRMCRDVKFEYGQVRCLGHRAGRDLGRQIIKGLPNKRILWAAYDDSSVFPRNSLAGVRSGAAKDASDMTDAEIRQCLRGAVSNMEYSMWNVENSVA